MRPTSPSTCRANRRRPHPRPSPTPADVAFFLRQISFSPPQFELQRDPKSAALFSPLKNWAKSGPNFARNASTPPAGSILGSMPLTTTPLHRPFSLARNSSTPPSDTNASFGPPSCTPEIPRPPLQIQTLALDPPHAPPSGPFVLKLSKNPSKKLENRPPAQK